MILLVGRVGADTLELSDGWYSLPCPLNYGDPLHKLVTAGIVITIVEFNKNNPNKSNFPFFIFMHKIFFKPLNWEISEASLFHLHLTYSA